MSDSAIHADASWPYGLSMTGPLRSWFDALFGGSLAVDLGRLLIIGLLQSGAGGLLMGTGARLAGGCTSGHGISGTMQLNTGSWIAVICLFIGGIAVAIPLFTL